MRRLGLQPTGEPVEPYPSVAAMEAEGMRPTGRELDLYNCAADLVNLLGIHKPELLASADHAVGNLQRALRRYRVPRLL